MTEVVQGDARNMDFLDDDSVDLIVTSPPYWGLRSYRDDGEHYSGQVGSEDTPQQFVEELVGMIDSEWRRVLKPAGSLWLNLGDKYAGSGGHNNSGLPNQDGPITGTELATRRDGPNRYKQTDEARPKSLLGLPWRVALALIDRGWILRRDQIWSKPNGLPESVTDRTRSSHEYWFHFVLGPRYFSAIDEIREPSTVPPGAPGSSEVENKDSNDGLSHRSFRRRPDMFNPLGRTPGSVWSIPGEGDKVVVTLAAWRNANGLCLTCGKTPRRGAGNGLDGETPADTASPQATSNRDPKTGPTESPTDSMSAPSLKDSPSTISAETQDASTRRTSNQSPSPSTSDEESKPTKPTPSACDPQPAAAPRHTICTPQTGTIRGSDGEAIPGDRRRSDRLDRGYREWRPG